MTKQEAISIFGSGRALADALGLTKGRISQLPEKLDGPVSDRVIGAAVRLGMADRLPESCQQLMRDHVCGGGV